MIAFITGKGRRRRPPAVSRLGAVVLAAGLVLGLAVVLPRPGALADRVPSGFHAGQVRIFQNGDFRGGGTLVAPNWVLTALHLFARPDAPAAYSLRFGDINNSGDPVSQANLRQVDRIVPAAQGDLAMVHFAQAVPAGSFIPELATQQPDYATPARMYGWGSSGAALTMATGVVLNPDGGSEAAMLRQLGDANIIYAFPQGVNPVLTTLPTVDGDSGSGVYTGSGILTGVHVTRVIRTLNAGGKPTGISFETSWEEPVWSFRPWIQDTINGAGSSAAGQPPNDELRRRLLADDRVSGTPVMTNPPQSLYCADGDPSCTEPASVTGTLPESAASPGLTPAACAAANPGSCSLGGVSFVPGAAAQQGVKAGLQVEAWCRATAVLTPGGPPQAVAEVSFTNADPAQPRGYGWWDISPASIATAAGPLDPAALSPCPSQPDTAISPAPQPAVSPSTPLSG